MIKNIYQLATLGCLSVCVLGAAQAGDWGDWYEQCSGGKCDIKFIDSPNNAPLGDMACSPSSLPAPSSRKAVYTLYNYEANKINLYDIYVNFANDHGVVIGIDSTASSDPPNCVTNVDGGGRGEGSIEGYSSCQITINYTPPACGDAGPIEASLDGELYIGIVDAHQTELKLDLDSNLTVVGAGGDFAILSDVVANNTGSGTTNVSGNIAYKSSITPVTGGFNVINGDIYLSTASTYAQNAATDFNAAFHTLVDLLDASGAGCQMRARLLNGETVTPGSYCFTGREADQTAITFGGGPFNLPIIFDGNDTGKNFYLYIDSNSTGTCANSGTEAEPDNYCDLKILPTQFVFKGGATADNLYIILGNTGGKPGPQNPGNSGRLNLGSDALIAGTFLVGSVNDGIEPAIYSESTGTLRTSLIGRLYGVFDGADVVLNGNSVSVPQ